GGVQAQPFDGGERLAESASLERDRYDTRLEDGALVALQPLQAALQVTNQRWPVVGLLVQPLEGHVHASVVRREQAVRFPVGDGTLRILRYVARGDRRFAQPASPLDVVVAGQDGAIVKLEQFRPARLRAQRELDAVDGPARRRLVLQQQAEQRSVGFATQP